MLSDATDPAVVEADVWPALVVDPGPSAPPAPPAPVSDAAGAVEFFDAAATELELLCDPTVPPTAPPTTAATTTMPPMRKMMSHLRVLYHGVRAVDAYPVWGTVA